MDRKAVLYIDDSETGASIVRSGLGSCLVLLWAATVAKAEDMLRHRSDIHAIIIGQSDDATSGFIQKRVAASFRGPLIAATLDAATNASLKADGCTHAVPGRHSAVHLVRSICNGSAYVPAGS